MMKPVQGPHDVRSCFWCQRGWMFAPIETYPNAHTLVPRDRQYLVTATKYPNTDRSFDETSEVTWPN